MVRAKVARLLKTPVKLEVGMPAANPVDVTVAGDAPVQVPAVHVPITM